MESVGTIARLAGLLSLAFWPTPQADVIAELPRVYLDTAVPQAPARGGTILRVGSGGGLQEAIHRAKPGDVIELAKGATFTGNFVLPNKNTASENWIVIRPANYASLPAEGVRMTPEVAASLALPRILTPNANNALTTALGAHHYRLIGLEVGAAADVKQVWALVGLDGQPGQRTMEAVPHDLVLDRMYIHGTPELTLRRCVALNSASTGIVDSWLSDCHEKGADSQAIASWNGPGPFKIVNNYLEGAGENLMFGGSDPSIPDLTPSDIEIRRNHFYKPVAWKGKWTVKNLLEIKHGQRVLIEGNVLENSWADGQSGGAVAIKTVNQNGKCTWCVTRDVTVRLNHIRNVGSGFNIAGAPDNNAPAISAHRITVTDNLITNMNVPPFMGDGRGFSTYVARNVSITHNTMIAPFAAAFVFGPFGKTTMGFVARDNIVGGGAYGVIGDNYCCAKALEVYAPDSDFRGNVMIMPRNASLFPAGNFYPGGVGLVGFTDPEKGDFSLLPRSQYRGQASDGRDPGANFGALQAAIQGVRVERE